jgi:hypothetical protein
VIDFDENGLQWDFLSYPSCDQRLQAHIVNYAADFVIFCHRKTAQAQAHRKDNGQTPKAIYWGILGHDMSAFSNAFSYFPKDRQMHDAAGLGASRSGYLAWRRQRELLVVAANRFARSWLNRTAAMRPTILVNGLLGISGGEPRHSFRHWSCNPGKGAGATLNCIVLLSFGASASWPDGSTPFDRCTHLYRRHRRKQLLYASQVLMHVAIANLVIDSKLK